MAMRDFELIPLSKGLALLAACLLSSTLSAQISTAERDALIDLYHATDGDDWIENSGWMDAAGTECDWYGVDCLTSDAGGRYVYNLRLSANGLAGTLPESLVDLDRMRVLNLDDNDIQGSIPAVYGEFPELGHLDLGSNALTGFVPFEFLTGPLEYIYLGDNQLTGYSGTSASQSSAWVALELSGNPIETLPPASWRMTGAIASLGLSRSGLSGELDFGHHAWPELQWLELADNQITGLSGIDTGTLPDLRQLDLAGNRITDQWPVSGQTLANLAELDLTGNGLSASPPVGLSGHPRLRELHLSGNALAGADLGELFAMENARMIDLSGNPLEALPSGLPGPVADMSELHLSATRLSGAPPAWFDHLGLTVLDLSGNQLDGSIEPWLDAMLGDFRTRLNLSRNLFEGPLPEALPASEFADNGLELCWNRFEAPFDPDIEAFLETAHRGGSLAACNDRELDDMDLTVSGSWYNPDRSGKGYTLMLLESGTVLHYWFGFPDAVDAGHDRQMWSFELAAPDDSAAVFPPSLVPYGGRFEQGLADGRATPYGRRALEMIRLADDRLSVYSSWSIQGRQIIIDPPLPPTHERFDHQRLTELAGTTCENQSPFQAHSGAWFNPERSGEGFVLEALPDGRGLVYWFTYTPDESGRQAWMIGSGMFESLPTIGTPPPGTEKASLAIESMIQPTGTVLGPDFDADAIELVDWGSLEMVFYVDGTGKVSWDSALEEYGSGDYPIERLARPMLAECD